MAYRILFSTVNSQLAQETYETLAEQGHEVFTQQEWAMPDEPLDMLVLALPDTDVANQGRTIRDDLDYAAMLHTLDRNINGMYETVKAALPHMRKGGLKRIALLTDQGASIRESGETTEYGYHMSQAAANMLLKLLFNTYRPEGFTFRCYAGKEEKGGVSTAEYLLTGQSYIETDEYIHSDENRIVLRDPWMRELSW